jgi:hypothetical protein
MAETLSFTTATRNKKPIPFVLDGTTYEFTPPKQTAIFLELMNGGNGAAITKKAFDWLSDGLPEEQNDKLVERLRDPNDDFDLPDLRKILEKLQEAAAGGPTT